MKKITLVSVFFMICCCGSLFAKDISLQMEPAKWGYSPGAEFPGATGKLAWTPQNTFRLDGDFTGGGDYVMAFMGCALSYTDTECLWAEVRTNGNAVTFRIQDGAGKMHQYNVPVNGTNQWQRVEQPLVFSGCSWGGPDNKRFTPGIIYVGCLLRKETSPPDRCSYLEVRRIGVKIKDATK